MNRLGRNELLPWRKPQAERTEADRQLPAGLGDRLLWGLNLLALALALALLLAGCCHAVPHYPR